MRVLLFGMLVASPVVAVWKFRASNSASFGPQVRQTSSPSPADPTVRVPVEVIANGSAPEWVYIEVATQVLPTVKAMRDSR